jgi:hypothetical protein
VQAGLLGGDLGAAGVNHDMTLDRAPMPEQQMDPKGLTNYDGPFFDLASYTGAAPGWIPLRMDCTTRCRDIPPCRP